MKMVAFLAGGGGLEAGGTLRTVRDTVVKLYRYVVRDGDDGHQF